MHFNNLLAVAAVPVRSFYTRLMLGRQKWKPEQINAYQEKKLRKIVRHCWECIPFYRQWWRNHIDDYRNIRTIADLQKLPVVSKSDIRTHLIDIQCKCGCLPGKEARTGGSTGQPIVFRMTRLDEELAWAQMYVGWQRAGYRIGDPFLVVGGESVGVGLGDKRIWRDRLLNRWLSSGMNITRDRVLALTKSRPFSRISLIYGYPSAISELCRHLAVLNSRPLRLKGVVTTAEVLRPEIRQQIKDYLNVENVIDQWGLNDGGMHAAEGVESDGFHLSFHRGILEIVDDQDRQIWDTGVVGRGIATSLSNFSTPFVRYDTGDQLHWQSFEPAASGITWPRLGPIDGRTGDVIALPGKSITMPGLTLVMRWIDGLEEYQFIQTGPREVRVILKTGDGFHQTKGEISNYLSRKIDDRVKWHIEWGNAERTPNGKILIVINRYSPD